MVSDQPIRKKVRAYFFVLTCGLYKFNRIEDEGSDIQRVSVWAEFELRLSYLQLSFYKIVFVQGYLSASNISKFLCLRLSSLAGNRPISARHAIFEAFLFTPRYILQNCKCAFSRPFNTWCIPIIKVIYQRSSPHFRAMCVNWNAKGSEKSICYV